MIVNGVGLIIEAPIKDMIGTKVREHGVSHGLSEVGYDIRLKQEVRWTPPDPIKMLRQFRDWEDNSDIIEGYYEDSILEAFYGFTEVFESDGTITRKRGRTLLASSVERFQIPSGLWCEFRNKSTWARNFLDATIGTDGEPGWCGHLTIEIIFHDNEPLTIPAGAGILKAVFHQLKYNTQYDGKYQNQEDKPVPAIFE